MILIWSGEGGPLQWLSVALVFLQFLVPPVLRLTAEFRSGADYEERSGNSDNNNMLSVPLMWVACALFTAIFVGGMWVIGEVLCWSAAPQDDGDDPQEQDREGENDNAAAEDHQQQGNSNSNNNNENGTDADNTAPLGTAANPVIIEDDDDNAWTRAFDRFNRMLPAFSPTHLMLAMGFILPLAMIAPLLLNGIPHQGINGMFSESGGIVQVTALAIIAHSMMAIAAYRVLREVVDGGGVGPYPGNIRGGRRRRGRKLTVSEIADIVRKVPVEEYVSEEDVRTGDCSVARMKRMLVNRGASEAADMCVERDDLVKEVEKVRNFNEECAICAEEYVEGDVLRVTHCKHEFHLHCFDKWIYTFSTDSRHATHPTCPLCKATIK